MDPFHCCRSTPNCSLLPVHFPTTESSIKHGCEARSSSFAMLIVLKVGTNTAVLEYLNMLSVVCVMKSFKVKSFR
jgi:hypothetical protein